MVPFPSNTWVKCFCTRQTGKKDRDRSIREGINANDLFAVLERNAFSLGCQKSTEQRIIASIEGKRRERREISSMTHTVSKSG